MSQAPKVYTRGSSLFFTLKGPFDQSAGFALWEVMRPDDWRRDWYVLDMVEVRELRDTGLQWLRMFVTWAQRIEVGVCVLNLQPYLKKRLDDFGIELVDGEPVLHKLERPAVRAPVETRGYARSGRAA